jgi:hypothetical protein
MEHASTETMRAALPHVSAAPRDNGTLALIVRRPAVGERELLESGELDPRVGLVGDTWDVRESIRTPDRSPHPDMQLTLMNLRFTDVIAGDRERWPLAGDQLYVDFDLSHESVPPGARIAIGSAVVELTDQPHTGCAKFTQRFGLDALRFVNTPEGMALRLRGANARVVQAGTVSVGDTIRRLSS